MKKTAMVLVLLASASWAAGDVLRLLDGTSLTGDVKRSGEGWVVIAADGKQTLVSADRVKSIELGKDPGQTPGANADAATERLSSLRRAVENMDDLGAIVQRYQAFVTQNRDNPAGVDAIKDLADWQDRKQRGLVKAAGKWMTPEEKGQLKCKAIELVHQAREMVKQGRLTEAEPVINEALAGDPRNASALYLRGLLQYRQDQIAPARKSFEQVSSIVRDHAPTLNNLAVVAWRQKDVGVALNLYDRALMTSPAVRKEVLNNVAEALAALSEDQKATLPAQKLSRRFAELEGKFEEQMAAEGLYRWGATWVNQTQLDRLKEAEADIKGKLDTLAQDYDAAQLKIRQIDDDMARNTRLIGQIEAYSMRVDSKGNRVQVAYPQSYYDMARDNERLGVLRAQHVAKLEGLKQQAKQIQQQIPVPKYTGVQQMVGPEGTPLVLDDPSTTAPTTSPTK